MAKAKAKAVEKKREKVVEDKTFGLKNQKGRKARTIIKQVQSSVHGSKGGEAMAAKKAADNKRAKEQQKAAEKEMLDLLGDAYALSGKKKPKSKETKKLAKKAEEEKKAKAEEDMARQKEEDEKDFGVPICPLRDVYGLGQKAVVERLCVEIDHKDNLVSKAHDGTPCLHVKVSDGTTRNPMTMVFMGETPQTFKFKVGMILDVRQIAAMVRGQRVLLEVPKGAQGLSSPEEGIECSVSECSERLTKYIKEKIVEEEEIRERGGIPIEERIEEERANLTGTLTPVTKERFFAWKEKKRKEKEEAERQAAESAKKAGKSGTNVLSGRALFQFDQSMFADDEGAMDDKGYERSEDYQPEDNAPTRAYSDGKDEESGDDNDDDNDNTDAEAEEDGQTGASAKPPVAPKKDGAIQETLYLEGGDDDLDDLDDDDDDDDDDDEE